jgi:diadenosine tetraphosphate (Ap4A) HIT family hydrolase
VADYPALTPDGVCIFCAIAADPSYTPGVFWEDEEFMAFLSLWPNTEGFSVVIPKAHYPSDVLRMPDVMLGRFVSAAKRVAAILEAHFDDVGRVGVMMEGTGIDHAHIKLFPMHGTGYMKHGAWRQHNSRRRDFFTTYEGYLSSHEGPRVPDVEIARLAAALRAHAAVE